MSILKIEGGGGVNPDRKFVNADQTISTIAVDAIVNTETVINSVIGLFPTSYYCRAKLARL